jgi:hypothetical protein
MNFIRLGNPVVKRQNKLPCNPNAPVSDTSGVAMKTAAGILIVVSSVIATRIARRDILFTAEAGRAGSCAEQYTKLPYLLPKRMR